MNSLSKQRSVYFSVTSVASVALEAEIDECHTRLLSGEIVMSNSSANNPGEWSKSSREIAVKPFVDAFMKEIKRLEGIFNGKWSMVSANAEALLKDSDALARSRDKGTLSESSIDREVAALRKQARALQVQTLQVMKETTKNQKELNRIAMLADSKLGTSTVDELSREFVKEPWTDQGSSGHIVKLLSDIFSLIREIEENAKNKDGKWVAPQSFERVTKKYWVLDDDLPEVLLKSASELPLLVYGKSGLLTKDPKDPSKGKVEFWKAMAAPIASVYFDSRNMDLYKERIKRSEGAQLVRVRWYGAKKPADDKIVFLELKTHHECWIDNKSVKERVNLRQKRMNDLIDISDGVWDMDKAKEIVLEAYDDPDTAKTEEVEASAALLVEIRSIFVKLELIPCVRTRYTRAAFQNPNNNDLRLTIDRDITVIDESRNWENGQTPSSWCIDDNEVVPMDSFIKVPYGVFEVKVSGGEDPLFVEELKESQAIVEAHKFSKFLTGASLYNAKKVNMLPWWSEDALFDPMFKRQLGLSRKRASIKASLKAAANPMYQANNKEMERLSEELTVKSSKRESEKSLVDIEKGTLNDVSESSFKESSDSGLFSFGLKKRKSKKGSVKSAPRSPARVEPKSFFANERTFIQWVTVGSLFMTVASLVYDMALGYQDTPQGRMMMGFGHAIIAASLFVAFYGTGMYYRRLYLMMNAKPYGYADAFGPALFSLMIITLLGTFIFVSDIPFRYPNTELSPLAGVCVQRNLDLGITSGISVLQFEPSAIVVDETRDMLIVASLDHIVALPAGVPTDPAAVSAPFTKLYEFPEGTEDLEALEIVEGNIYAISENKVGADGSDESDIISFAWTPEGTLNVTNRWRVKVSNAEGMAYTTDKNWFQNPYMLVAGEQTLANALTHLDLTAFQVPFPTAERLVKRHVNNKFFYQGITDTKVSAMQFFGGLLYALYNHEQLIRAYDSAGVLVNEWAVPVGKRNYETEWEGMRLQQSGDDLYLHLGLDSEPQIWSIKLDGETSANAPPGQWIFPKCAQA